MVVGAHYDTKDLPGFVGAVDGASGTAVVVAAGPLAGPAASSVVFVLFDGEESPRGSPDSRFAGSGCAEAGSPHRRFRDARSMMLLDLVGDRRLRAPREGFSDGGLWATCGRRGAPGAGAPSRPRSGPASSTTISVPSQGVPAVDLIDFDFPCFHRRCDDLRAVSERSLDPTGRPVCCRFELARYALKRCPPPREAPACRPPRLLRGRGPRRPDRRARARAVRPARLRAQGDRAQQARRRAAARARRGFRRGGDRGARGRDGRVLRPRRGAGVHANAAAPQAAHDRRHLPARHEGAPGGGSSPARDTRSCWSATRATRRSRARWGRRPDHRADRDRGGRRPVEVDDPDRLAYLTQTTLCRWTRPTGSSAGCGSASRRWSGPHTDDICYATTNRQLAVRQMARECDLVLVIGSQQLLELEPPGGGRARPRRRVPPDRQRAAGSRSRGSKASASSG